MEKSNGKVVVDVHANRKVKVQEYQEGIRETELKVLRFINKTLGGNEIENNPEMVSALSGLLKVVKQHY